MNPGRTYELCFYRNRTRHSLFRFTSSAHVYLRARTVDHLQIMLSCLHHTFMANDVCFILIKHVFE